MSKKYEYEVVAIKLMPYHEEEIGRGLKAYSESGWRVIKAYPAINFTENDTDGLKFRYDLHKFLLEREKKD